ncbi:hypothetical protein ZO67_22825, partial [Salmonella enterica subsp. enterica]|nr:hypothetical protein [Salmonella enterica subsp. enterica serovar Cerro]
MDGLSGGSGECLDCPASVAGAEGWRGVFQQPARSVPHLQVDESLPIISSREAVGHLISWAYAEKQGP